MREDGIAFAHRAVEGCGEGSAQGIGIEDRARMACKRGAVVSAGGPIFGRDQAGKVAADCGGAGRSLAPVTRRGRDKKFSALPVGDVSTRYKVDEWVGATTRRRQWITTASAS